MVALPVITIFAIGIVASVVKVVIHEVGQFTSEKKLKDLRAKTEILNTTENERSTRELATTLSTTILINGKDYTFLKDTAHSTAHYDLAIDFCLNNGTIVPSPINAPFMIVFF
jgi:hypothetical protein